jgi:hypothetical protein
LAITSIPDIPWIPPFLPPSVGSGSWSQLNWSLDLLPSWLLGYKEGVEYHVLPSGYVPSGGEATTRGPLLSRLYSSLLDNINKIYESKENINNYKLGSPNPSESRLSWYADFGEFGETSRSIVLTLDSTFTLKRAQNSFEFLNSPDPIYLMNDSGVALLRNLALREVSSTSTSGIYHLLERLVDDEDIYIFYQDRWIYFPCTDPGFNAEGTLDLRNYSISGTIKVRYSSLELMRESRSSCITIDGHPISPAPYDLWNSFDDLGLLLGLERDLWEDNKKFLSRIHSVFQAPGGSTPNNLETGVSRDLALIQVINWDASEILELTRQGCNSITVVNIPNLREVDSTIEDLIPSLDRKIWKSNFTSWLSGEEILIDNYQIANTEYTISGSTLNFNHSVSGKVTAKYHYRNYSINKDTSGFIVNIVPTDNIREKNYLVVTIPMIRIHSLSDSEYSLAYLYNPDDSPTSYLLELSDTISKMTPTSLGYSAWDKVSWQEENNLESAKPFYLPSSFDRTLA